MTARQVDDIIDRVSELVGGDENRGLVAFILRTVADKASNTDEFAAVVTDMIRKHYEINA